MRSLESLAALLRFWWYPMTEATCSMRECLQRHSSQRRHRVFRARAICSIVTSGFFPPEPSRLLSEEEHDQLAEDHVSDQSSVAAAFEVSKADLGFGDSEDMFDTGPGEGDFHECGQGGSGRSVGDEVFDLARPDIGGDDQPVSAIGGPAAAGEVDLLGFDFPDLRRQGLAMQTDLPPFFAEEGLAADDGTVGALGL